MPKNLFFPFLKQLLMVPLPRSDQKLPKKGHVPKKKYFLNFSQISGFFFKQMAVACSIFTLDGGFQLLWAAFGLPMTMVPLKVALGLEKFDFWSFH